MAPCLPVERKKKIEEIKKVKYNSSRAFLHHFFYVRWQIGEKRVIDLYGGLFAGSKKSVEFFLSSCSCGNRKGEWLRLCSCLIKPKAFKKGFPRFLCKSCK